MTQKPNFLRANRLTLIVSACLLACLSYVAFGSLSVTSAENADLRFTILHTNDLHAHAESFADRGRLVGGLARIGHLIRSLRSQNPNTVVVDAGDIFQGTPLFTRYHGEVEVNLLNKVGYDIYTIGNHEFDDGAENLTKQLKLAKFDIISSNLDAESQPELKALIKPSTIRTFKGEKVAFVGAMTPDLERLSLSLGGVKVKGSSGDWIAPVKDEVKRLSDQGIDKIVLVTHLGVDYDQELAKAVPQIDVIIGGHSHTRLDKEVVVDQPGGASTVIVQTGCYGRALGKLDLAFDKEGRLLLPEVKYSLINVNSKIPEEPDLKAYVDEKVKPLLSMRSTIVSFAEKAFDNRWTVMPWDSSIGDLITDSLADAGKDYGVTVSIHNRGGIRGRIEPGPISLEKVEEILPFDNRLTLATISGVSLKRALEHSVNAGLGGHFLDVHGVKFAYDHAKPRGQRVVFAYARDAKGNWKPVDEKESYRIAVNNYTFQSGEGFNFADARDVQFTKERVSIPFKNYLLKNPRVSPQPPNRIVPVTEGLLSLSGSDTLRIDGAAVGSRITLVRGTGEGVEPVFGSIPVPLKDAFVIASGIDVEQPGAVTIKNLSRLLEKGKDVNAPAWVAAIVHPPKKGRNRKTLISYPIQVTETTQTTTGNKTGNANTGRGDARASERDLPGTHRPHASKQRKKRKAPVPAR